LKAIHTQVSRKENLFFHYSVTEQSYIEICIHVILFGNSLVTTHTVHYYFMSHMYMPREIHNVQIICLLCIVYNMMQQPHEERDE